MNGREGQSTPFQKRTGPVRLVVLHSLLLPGSPADKKERAVCSLYDLGSHRAGRISARFSDRIVIRSFTLSAPYLRWQSGYLHRFRTCYPLLHPVSPVSEVAVRISAPFPGNPDRIIITPPCQPRTGVAGRISAPFPDGIVITPPCQPRT